MTIALGVGATTAIFSIVDAVLLRPLPYPDQGSLVQLFDVDVNGGRHNGVLSLPEFTDWRDRGRDVFESMGAIGGRGEVLSGVGDAEQLMGAQVTREGPDSSDYVRSWDAESSGQTSCPAARTSSCSASTCGGVTSARTRESSVVASP